MFILSTYSFAKIDQMPKLLCLQLFRIYHPFPRFIQGNNFSPNNRLFVFVMRMKNAKNTFSSLLSGENGNEF